jgi:hypothetical protein
MIRHSLALLGALLAAMAAPVAFAAPRENLLPNPDFEAEDAAGWEKRTPDDADRALSIVTEAAHSGKRGARITNRKPTISRWRLGADGKIKVPEGATIRLSGWIRSDLGTEGYASLRLYCMRDRGEIMAQRDSRHVIGKSDWTRVAATVKVPEGTQYVMAYLELQNAVGTADYDDLSLEVLFVPEPVQVRRDLILLTDAPEEDATVRNLETLYPRRITRSASGAQVDWESAQGAIVYLRDPAKAPDLAAVERFAASGKPVVMDLGVYARARGLELKETTGDDEPTLRIVEEDPITRGFRAGDTIPWYGGAKGAYTQRALATPGRARVLAESSRGGALLVVEKVGQGSVLATDLVTLPEPVWSRPGSFNKHLFLGNLLGKSTRYGRYFRERLTYEGFVAAMRALANEQPALRFMEEGPAHGDYRLCSLNLGEPGRPAFLVYGVAHGSEWEPAYGLLELARLLASPEGKGLFDTSRYSLKIVPIINPTGYDLFTRQNANKVDLNRNAIDHWETYQGRDSNKDGVYGPGDYDWKGTASCSEPETRTIRRICEELKPHAVLDFHGNAGGRGNNRLILLPRYARPENEELAYQVAEEFNQAFRDRYVLHEASRPGVQQYEIEAVQWSPPRPTLTTLATRDRLGFVCEVPAGYRGTHGTVFQTDVVIETCLAFFRVYQKQP